jgi:putative spermidine/putrescine transport system ATP-binding protein
VRTPSDSAVGEKPAAAASLPVTIRELTKRYGSFAALKDVDLAIRSGEFLTLLGPSGSGKTTLLMVLAGFVRPDAGSVAFGEREVVLLPPHKRDIGMVFQNYALFPHMTVAGNLAYPLKLRGHGKQDIADRVAQALALVQLEGYGERGVDQLSGGQRQRVALARAVIFEPRILLMDEPLSALDKNLRERMQLEIRRLHDRLGLTTVYVTHDQREALTMSDRIAVMNHGQILQVDRPRDLYDRPSTRFIAEFIGETHCIPIEIQNGEASLFGRTLRLATPLGNTAPAQALVLRPERLQLVGVDQPTHDLNTIDGTVRQHVFQGDSVVTFVSLPDGHDIAVRHPYRNDSEHLQPGTAVRVGIAPRDTIVVPVENATATASRRA